MVQKLSFSIEDAEVVRESPTSNFAVVSLDFFASGENLHDMYISEETLMRTADTIKNCPLVWKYDERLDDIYTHDKDEVPCGFVPETATIQSRVLPDGRTMLSVIAYVWKRYTGALLSFFKRDGGKKPVSVEMTVSETRELPNGLLELVDFRYEGITILGSFVTPAIPLANATVLSFAEMTDEYQKDLEKEFSTVNLEIPEGVQLNAQKGLELRKQYSKGGAPVSLSFAKYLTTEKEISTDKLRRAYTYFQKHRSNRSVDSETPSAEYIDWLLWGGDAGYKWAEETVERLNFSEKIKWINHSKKEELVTFPYKSMKDANPALKGIDPPITVSQANDIAKQADSIGTDGEKNGWAIAISSFKKTHVVKDGKWVKKSTEEMEMSSMEEEKILTAEMAADTAESEKKETPAEEKAETKEEEKKEIEKGIEKKFEFPNNFNLEQMSKMFAEDEEEDVKMAKAELEKGEFANPSIVMGGMFAKMCKMAELVAKMAEDSKVYMAENEELRKFKADVEMSQKQFAVEQTIRELSEKVIIPDEAKAEMIEEAGKYSFADIEAWKTYCKAKSFEFAIKENGKSDTVRVALPFTEVTPKKNDDLWS